MKTPPARCIPYSAHRPINEISIILYPHHIKYDSKTNEAVILPSRHAIRSGVLPTLPRCDWSPRLTGVIIDRNKSEYAGLMITKSLKASNANVFYCDEDQGSNMPRAVDKWIIIDVTTMKRIYLTADIKDGSTYYLGIDTRSELVGHFYCPSFGLVSHNNWHLPPVSININRVCIGFFNEPSMLCTKTSCEDHFYCMVKLGINPSHITNADYFRPIHSATKENGPKFDQYYRTIIIDRLKGGNWPMVVRDASPYDQICTPFLLSVKPQGKSTNNKTIRFHTPVVAELDMSNHMCDPVTRLDAGSRWFDMNMINPMIVDHVSRFQEQIRYCQSQMITDSALVRMENGLASYVDSLLPINPGCQPCMLDMALNVFVELNDFSWMVHGDRLERGTSLYMLHVLVRLQELCIKPGDWCCGFIVFDPSLQNRKPRRIIHSVHLSHRTHYMIISNCDYVWASEGYKYPVVGTLAAMESIVDKLNGPVV